MNLTRNQMRSRRKREVRSHTIRVTNEANHKRQARLRMIEASGLRLDHERPRVRLECIDGERPCPYVGCRYHLYLDVSPHTGNIKLNFPDAEPGELAQSCALDVAEAGGITLERLGEMMNLTRERARQIELAACTKLEATARPLLRDHVDLPGEEEDPSSWVPNGADVDDGIELSSFEPLTWEQTPPGDREL